MYTKKPSIKVPSLTAALISLGALTAFLLILRPAEVPPLWSDEGWNVSVARNWVELGRYCLLRDGEPIAPSMLSTGFPAILPVALSFRIFGVGVLQARLPGIFFTAGAMALISLIAYKLSGPRVAIGTLAVLLLIPGNPQLHPILIGRQALGEMPALFFLLCGYEIELLCQRRRRWLRILIPLFWGAALMIKAQVIPFFVLAIVVPVVLAVAKRVWVAAGLASLALFGSFAVFYALMWIQTDILRDPMPPQTHIATWSASTAVVLISLVRVNVIIMLLIWGSPLLIGLASESWQFAKRSRMIVALTGEHMVGLSLLVLSGSWCAWYMLLSIGWARYLFPALFIGSIFTAQSLFRLTEGLNPLETLKKAGSVILNFHWNRQGVKAVLMASLIGWMTLFSPIGLFLAYFQTADRSLLETAHFLNTQTRPDVVVECSEPELFFLLERRYHFLSLETSLQQLRHSFLGADPAIGFNPLEADPDYLVTGPSASAFQFYDRKLRNESFRLLRRIGDYQVYERDR